MPVEVLSTRDGYDRWAAVYDTDGNPLTALEEPWMDRLVGEVRGLKVLDVGCGTGRHAVQFARAGAEVEALDFSAAMLEKARTKAEGLSIRFHTHDLAARFPFADAAFDRVICSLVLEHIGDLPGIFREMHRVCRPTGHIVVSNMHPAMMLQGVQARFHDSQTGREIRPASCPHQVSDYVIGAIKAGLTVDHLSEHAVDETLAGRLERARRYIGWPMLMMMRLRPAAPGVPASETVPCSPAMTDDEFISAFEECRFSLRQWRHREHIRIAYLYLLRHPFEAALNKVRSGIQALNATHQVPDAIDRGYHETMTQAWMRLVHFTFEEFGPTETADAFLAEHTQLLSKRALRFYYSRARIMSAEAKRGFLEPDLAPFPITRANPEAVLYRKKKAHP
jgi:2-polyprenyl-3-methyl-5-hydroxy-6-metoxy-1,4-benzoquinol methylase